VKLLVTDGTNGDILPGMTAIVDRLVAEEHHLEEIAKDGYAPATLPIVLGGILLALTVIVGLALGVTLAVYYIS